MIHHPDFFIVGAPKSGTTSLFRYLSEHPQIFLPTVKEPHYFATDIPNLRFTTTLDEYLELFRTSRRQYLIFGEASAMYLYSMQAIPQIMQAYPLAKIIVMYRDPVDLAYSFHSQCLYGMEEDENDFHKAWQLQDDRINGRCLPESCNNPELLQYREVASLGKQFSRLFQIVPASQVLVIDFKDFIEHTPRIYQQVLQFLEVDVIEKVKFPAFNPHLSIKRNFLSRMVIKPPWPLNKIKRYIKKNWGLNDGLITNFIRGLISDNSKRPPLSELTRQIIELELAEDRKLLKEVLSNHQRQQLKKTA